MLGSSGLPLQVATLLTERCFISVTRVTPSRRATPVDTLILLRDGHEDVVLGSTCRVSVLVEIGLLRLAKELITATGEDESGQ